ncbi:MAG: Uma2 family endonuclease [Planctomycetes bacterium]|nr:Uma2 family endonuclease [Planctomycetota bacterium]
MRLKTTHSDSYLPDLPALAIDLPVLFEDEGQEHMGETSAHTHAAHTAYAGLLAHFADKSEYRVFANMSLYYHPANRAAYVSPDVMVVCPSRPLTGDVSSYRIGHDGPAPLLVVEVLGRRSLQQQDLTIKPLIYAQLGVKELLYVDTTGNYMPEKLQLRRLQLRDETWLEVPQGPNGQITSAFGYAVMVEPDQKVRFSNPGAKQTYPRLEETHDVITAWSIAMETLAQTKQARRQAEEQIRQLKAKLRASEGQSVVADAVIVPESAEGT